jgi:prepilin-type N-terminal cleavage/methylation domain-containing protein
MINKVHGLWFMVHGKKKHFHSTNYELPTNNQLGFSLVEILVVIAVLAIVGTIITEIFISSVRGSNKAAVISLLKRNGQTVLETMDKSIRNAKAVIYPYGVTTGRYNSDCVVVQTLDNKYIRYKFRAVGGQNGKVEVDYPQPSSQSELDPAQNSNFQGPNCDLLFPSQPPGSSTGLSGLTDTNSRNGVSVSVDTNFITRDVKEGFGDLVVIDFKVGPAVLAPAAYAGQIDAERFRTTIELRHTE